MVTDWTPESDEDRDRLLRMLRLSAAALKVRDGDAASARNAEQVGMPDRLENDQIFINAVNNNTIVHQEAIKESKELRKKVKKLEKRSARDGDTDAIMTVSIPNALPLKISSNMVHEHIAFAGAPGLGVGV